MATPSKPSSSRWQAWADLEPRMRVALAVLAIGSAFMLWKWVASRELPIEVHSRRFMEAFRSCDGAALYRYTFEEERRANGYTPSKMAEVCRQVVHPVLARFGTELKIETEADDEPSATTDLTARAPDGTVLRWGVEVYETPEGPRGNFLQSVFYAAYSEAQARKGVSGWDYRLLASSHYATYRDHSQLFDKLQIMKYPVLDRRSGRMVFTELRTNHEKYSKIIASNFEGVTATSWGPWSATGRMDPGGATR